MRAISVLLLASLLALPSLAQSPPRGSRCSVALSWFSVAPQPGAPARVDRNMHCSELSRQGWQTIWSLIGPDDGAYDEVFLVPLAIRGSPADDEAIGAFAVVPRAPQGADVGVWTVAGQATGVLIIHVGDPAPVLADAAIAMQLLEGLRVPRPTAAQGRSWLSGYLPELAPDPSITEASPKVVGRPGAELAPASPVQPVAVPVPCLMDAQCVTDQFAIGIRFRF